MSLFDIPIGGKFELHGETYEKTKPVKKGCCTVQSNAIRVNDGKAVYLPPHIKVQPC